MATGPQNEKVSKHTLTLPDGVYSALKVSAERVGLEPNDLIQDLIIDRVIADGTLDENTTKQINAYKWLVADAVERARDICLKGNFSPSLTADVFEAAANDPEWAAQYRFYIQDDIYKNGNPRKGPINREIGYRIRAAIGAEVEKDANGATALKKVTGLVIQSYTPFKTYNPALV
jgi:hypothetical protein